MDEKITGMMIYYLYVCERKLWYFCYEINMEQDNEDIILGKILDESSYKRDEKHINIDNTINIDFIKEHKEIHEIKKSRAIEEAGIWQVKYYLYYLQKRGVADITAKIDYPLLRERIEVTLTKDDINHIDSMIERIREIKNMEHPPLITSKSICKRCAYYDLCYI